MGFNVSLVHVQGRSSTIWGLDQNLSCEISSFTFLYCMKYALQVHLIKVNWWFKLNGLLGGKLLNNLPWSRFFFHGGSRLGLRSGVGLRSRLVPGSAPLRPRTGARPWLGSWPGARSSWSGSAGPRSTGSRSWSGSWLVDKLDFATVHLITIVLVQCSLHIAPGRKLYHPEERIELMKLLRQPTIHGLICYTTNVILCCMLYKTIYIILQHWKDNLKWTYPSFLRSLWASA